MEIQQLRCFVAVAEELHFGRAAERLRLTASPVSRAVKDLERELGADLFIRRYHNVALTETGADLVGPAKRVLDELDTMKELVRRRVGEVKVTLGSTHLAPHSLIDVFTEVVDEATPGVTIDFTWGTSSELLPRVEHGEVDLAMVHLPTDIAALDFVEVATYSFVVIVRADDPLAEFTKLSLSDLSNRTVITQPESPQPLAMNRFYRHLLAHGVTKFDRLDDHDPGRLAAHLRFSHGVYISRSPKGGGVARIFDDPAFAAIPLGEDDIPFAVGIVWLREVAARSTAVHKIVEAIRQRWAPGPDRY